LRKYRRMKNFIGVVLLLLAGGLTSGYISSASSKYVSGRVYVNTPVVETNPAVPLAEVFPVAGKRSTIGSFWGALREGGKRKHEGIDIFARKGTPVVAVSDGIVVEAGKTSRGGKTIWLRSYSDDFFYYYAHLDQHLVVRGQSVKKGQQLGTVGNTGNAKLTPPHLHFGIYAYSGAINPLPFVKNLPKVPILPKAKKVSETIAKSTKD